MKPIWTAQCILNNTIELHPIDWEHIIDGHPEMKGKEALVRQAIEAPLYVIEAGHPAAAAYILPPDADSPEGVRVIVGFNGNEMWVTGNRFGNVETAYPINTLLYPKPNLGSVVYSKPGAKR